MNSNKLFEFDKEVIKERNCQLIGTDEAGRGPGAGDVFSAAVYFPDVNAELISELSKLNDSKQLSERTREDLYEVIVKKAVWSVCQGSIEQIEKTNILSTSLWAMKMACEGVIIKAKLENPYVLVDGNKLIRDFKYNQKWVKKGDGLSASIAAASIIAKVTRDRYMDELDKEYPQYSWKKNKGYLTKIHLEAVDKYGLTKYHRKKFFEKHFQSEKQMALPL